MIAYCLNHSMYRKMELPAGQLQGHHQGTTNHQHFAPLILEHLLVVEQ